MANEKRLIRADSLLEKIYDTAEGLADCDQQNAAWALRKYAVRDIMDAETVDTVEVIRCRDCKFWIKFESSLIGEVMRCTGQGAVNIMKQPDDFCSCGKRKEDDANG